MNQEKYNLTWQPYSDHLRSMMKEMMMNEEYADVTLVTEDKKQIKAHINILSSCSPFFKDILKKEKNTNQIIYFRGIKFSEMESIMQFIYLGEATFYEERMDEFLDAAKLLDIKELCNAKAESNDDEPTPSNPVTSTEKLKQAMVESDKPDEECSPCAPVTSTEKMREEIVLSDESAQPTPQERRREVVSVTGKYECEPCQKTFNSRKGLDYHIQSVHQGVKYACDQCDHQYTDKSSLNRHIQSKHKGVKYACDQCDYQATHQSNLTVHIQSKHEGVKFACDQCDYQTTMQKNLTQHIQSKHEGVRYACDHCDYQATDKRNLTRHIQTVHEGIMKACDLCDYKAKDKRTIINHIKSMHSK